MRFVEIAFFVALALLLSAQCSPLGESGVEKKKFDRIVLIGDFHGDLIRAMRLLFMTDLISLQPDFYKNKLVAGFRSEVGKGPAEKSTGHQIVKGVDENMVNGNMIFNKRGYIMAGSEPDTYHWAGKKALCVIPGDAVDVGPGGIDIVRFLMRLEKEAAEAGGKLVFLLGNHEMLNLEGQFNGVHPWAFEKSGGRVGRLKLLSMENPVGRWLRSRDILFFNDGLLYMHGGVTEKVLKTFEEEYHMKGKIINAEEWVEDLNSRVHDVLQGKKRRSSDHVAELVLNVDYKANGAWYKNPLLVHPLKICPQVDAAVKTLKDVHGVIVGHTPHNIPQYDFCQGRLFAVDFKNSEWKSGKQSDYAALVMTRKPGTPTEKDWDQKGIFAGWKPDLKVTQNSEFEPPKPGFYSQFASLHFWIALLICVAIIEFILWLWRRKRGVTVPKTAEEVDPLQANKRSYGAA